MFILIMEEIFMKKLVLILVLLLSVSMLLIAQSTNNEQRLVGTWINDLDGSRWIFNSDGTVSGSFVGFRLAKYAVAEEKIVLIMDDSNFGGDFRISNDGRTLIIIIERVVLSFRRQ